MARVRVEAVYAERNQLVAALSKLFPAVRYCDGVWTAVYVDLPTGQVSWHYGPRCLAVCALAGRAGQPMGRP